MSTSIGTPTFTLQATVNVLNLGVKGDGTTDDTAAIQAVAGGGETDFFNSKSLGGGGFNFYNVATGFSGSPTLIASIDAIDGLTVPYVDINLGGSRIGSGTGVPSTARVAGSLWLRTDGGVGSTLYVSQGGGTWNAAAGV